MLTSIRFKRISALLLIAVCALALVSCGGAKESTPQQATEAQTGADTKAAQDEKTEETSVPATDSTDVLVAYFSATGTTKEVAGQIAAVTGADIYEIIPAEPYTAEDLDWNDQNSRTTIEQNDSSVRPAISSEKLNLDAYKTVYIGFPIWWGEEPRIMDTFVESYDFSGKTVVPFCTSGGSGIGSSGDNLEANAGSGSWLEGERLTSSSDIEGWVKGLN